MLLSRLRRSFYRLGCLRRHHSLCRRRLQSLCFNTLSFRFLRSLPCHCFSLLLQSHILDALFFGDVGRSTSFHGSRLLTSVHSPSPKGQTNGGGRRLSLGNGRANFPSRLSSRLSSRFSSGLSVIAVLRLGQAAVLACPELGGGQVDLIRAARVAIRVVCGPT